MNRAIVIGATSGIGLEVACLLAEQGYIVGVAGRRADRLEEIVKSKNFYFLNLFPTAAYPHFLHNVSVALCFVNP